MGFNSGHALQRQSVETKEENGETMGRLKITDKNLDISINNDGNLTFDQLETKSKIQ